DFFSIKEISGGCIIMTIKALVIDDERYAREELIYLLEQFEDINVSGEVENGEDALKKVLQEEPDVVFLDVEMPRMNGLRSQEHTSELQSRFDLVCRLRLEKKKIYD